NLPEADAMAAASSIEYVAADLATGEGLQGAFRGVDTVIHLAGSAKGDDQKARLLVNAAAEADVTHIVYISVVGADDIPIESAIDRGMLGYFGGKRAAEQIIAESGIPWTTLRATQFHDLTLKTVEAMAKLPIVPVPAGWRVQPIDASEVADRLVQVALAPPAGLVPEIGGPRVYEMDELVRSYLDATEKRRPIIHLPMPGKAARAYRNGANLAPDRAVGRRTWEAFLAERVGTARGAQPSVVTR
ncbi:MAG TPA: NAD(P)H-binding protein, partial [Candidatus Limnocylindria bacterium]|nr:NAD(P)H-binding protein [Candidatus Limnocylindria bacterium]